MTGILSNQLIGLLSLLATVACYWVNTRRLNTPEVHILGPLDLGPQVGVLVGDVGVRVKGLDRREVLLLKRRVCGKPFVAFTHGLGLGIYA